MLRRIAERIALCVGLTLGLFPAGVAEAREPRHAAMVLDANTGAVLHNEDGDEVRHPASLTKMMTLYLTFETIEQGRLSMSSMVKVSDEAAGVAPSKLGLEPGDEINVGDAVRALITKSANDVAVALAEKIGGSQANFVRLMNAKARALGMSKTNFENASGLPDDRQVTSARDMITLGLQLQDDFPQHYRLFATREFAYHGHSFRNHNTLMNSFAGIDGIKTGYTQASGFNLVSSVHRNGRHLVAAVFGGRSAATRNGEMRTILTRALNRASAVKTRKPAPLLIAKLKAEPKLAERPAKKPKLEAPTGTPARPIAELKPSIAEEREPAPKALAAAAKPARHKSQPAAPVLPAPPTAAIQPPAAAEPSPEPQSAPAEAAPSEPAPLAAEVQSSPVQQASPIEVAKVRRVYVAPRQGPPSPKIKASETTDMASDEDSLPDPSVSETIVPKTFGSPPDRVASLQNTPASMLGARDVIPPGPQASPGPELKTAAVTQVAPVTPAAPATSPNPIAASPVAAIPTGAKPAAAANLAKNAPSRARLLVRRLDPAKAKPLATADIKRGQPPSTLAAQAQNLRQPNSPAGESRLAALPPPQAGTAQMAGRFEIQIGAYASVGDAQQALSAAQSRAGALLANYPSVTQPVNKGGRQIYRARFRGFSSDAAAAACQKLRQQSLDCFVMTAE